MSYCVQVQRTVPRHGIIAILPRILPTLRWVWPEYEMRLFPISRTAVMPSKLQTPFVTHPLVILLSVDLQFTLFIVKPNESRKTQDLGRP